jgi:molecular chaperone DnaK (HSP70)
MDMGAGTTDLAGFACDTVAKQVQLREIAGTRQCCVLAGDELDGIVVDMFVRASGEKKLDAKDELWRALRLAAKQLKRDLFEKGKAVFKYGRRRIQVTRDALKKDASFRAYCRSLTEDIADSLAPLLDQAKAARVKSVSVLLAGGGANLPFLADLVREGASRSKTKVNINVERFGAGWTLPYRHHPFAGVFPQLAIAMGGAMAPVVQDLAPALT